MNSSNKKKQKKSIKSILKKKNVYHLSELNKLNKTYNYESRDQLIPQKDYFDFIYSQDRVECQVRALKLQYKFMKEFNENEYKNHLMSSLLKLAFTPKYKNFFYNIRLQLLMTNYIYLSSFFYLMNYSFINYIIKRQYFYNK